MTLGERIREQRTQNNMTQEYLAEQLNVSRQSVSKWESGASFPEMDTLLRICDLYDVNLDTLLRGSVEELTAKLSASSPLFMDVVPLNLEEIFIYELGGADHEVKDIVI